MGQYYYYTPKSRILSLDPEGGRGEKTTILANIITVYVHLLGQSGVIWIQSGGIS